MCLDDNFLVELVQKAIRIKSYSGQEKEVAELLKTTLQDIGYDYVIIDRFGSVIGTVNGNMPGPTILLDGHIDTVDVVDADKWQHDPFGAEICDGKIYGRGTSDMKASVCSFVTAVARFKHNTKGNFAGKICVSCTVHEECFEGVSSREVSRIVKPDFVIIGEATSGTVKIGQRGRAEVVVETEGVSCHSSNPEKGENAVYAMADLIEEIRKIKPNVHPVLGKGILELTDIVSSPYPGSSVVPSKCRVTYDRRILVGEDESVIIGQIENAIENVRKTNPKLKAKVCIAEGEQKCWTGDTIAAKRYFPAWCYSTEQPFIKKACLGLKKAGIDYKISHYSFCTNGSHFCGEAEIPGIGYGPSEEYLAHVRDEYIEIDGLLKSCKGFESILTELLCVN